MQTKIGAIIHVRDNGRHLDRALDSLRVCDELIVVVDHARSEEIARVVREHGGRVLREVPGQDAAGYAREAKHDWILWLRPDEAIAESLEASLFEWRLAAHGDDEAALNIAIREQEGEGWRVLPAETRLVHRDRAVSKGEMPSLSPDAETLEGHILRFQDE
jgi:hypothetical protein